MRDGLPSPLGVEQLADASGTVEPIRLTGVATNRAIFDDCDRRVLRGCVRLGGNRIILARRREAEQGPHSLFGLPSTGTHTRFAVYCTGSWTSHTRPVDCSCTSQRIRQDCAA